MQHQVEYIDPLIEDGYVVITDRYIASTYAYGLAHGVTKKQYKRLSKCYDFREADLNIWLAINAEEALRRTTKPQTYERMGLQFMKNVSGNYGDYFSKVDHQVVDVDRGYDIDYVHKQIVGLVKRAFY